MSGENLSEPGNDETAQPVVDSKEQPLRPKDIIFARQLAEVYLLIDNVSNFSNKEIPKKPDNNAQFDNAFKNTEGKSEGWLTTIVKIPWPPHVVDTDSDSMAAQLIMARDLLNNAAAPANGMTIAFSQTVLNQRGIRLRDLPKAIGALPSAIWHCLRTAFVPAQADNPDKDLRVTTAASISHDVARAQLYNIAYPTMQREAKAFMIRAFFLAAFMFVFTILTFSLSWTVTTGVALLANQAQARSEFDSAANDILTAQKGGAATTTKGSGGPKSGNAEDAGNNSASAQDKLPTSIVGYDAAAYCTKTLAALQPLNHAATVPAKGLPPQAAEVTDADLLPINRHALCTNYATTKARAHLADVELSDWNEREKGGFSAIGIPWLAALTQPPWPLSMAAKSRDTYQTDAQWASVWLHVMGGVVLPILYGVLGAGAAAGRMLSANLRENTLSPRDGLLAWVHVGLGSLIGGCIGLFVTPADVSPASPGSHLSIAALCFLAGFSVENVFQMLERIAHAAFNTPSPAKPKKS